MKRLSYIIAFAAAGAAPYAQAEIKDPRSFNAGGFELTPTLVASVGYDDNINTSAGTSSDPEVSANVYKVAPALEAKTEFGDHTTLTLITSSEKGVYGGQANNNYYDYGYGSDLEFRISNSQAIGLEYEFYRGHDPVGGSESTGARRPDEFRTNSGGLSYTLGSKGSTARLTALLSGEGKRYTTNQSFGSSTRDYDSEKADVTGYFNIAPRTELLLQAIYTDYDYVSQNTLDNENTTVFLGVEWEATAKTTGTVKIGKQEKEFTAVTPSQERDDTAWEVGVKWEPKSYSAFSLNTTRSIDNGTVGASGLVQDSIERTAVALGWAHNWSEAVKTNIGTSLTSEDYLGGVRNGIEAEIIGFNAGMEFQVERNFTLAMNYSYTDKSADLNGATVRSEEYTRNSAVVFGVEIGL